MTQYHEYYIGGPMDGQTRDVTKPASFMYQAIEYVDPLEVPEFRPNMDYPAGTLIEIMWNYYPKRVMLGSRKITFWADFRMLSTELIHARFWDLILEPHEFIPESTAKEMMENPR